MLILKWSAGFEEKKNIDFVSKAPILGVLDTSKVEQFQMDSTTRSRGWHGKILGEYTGPYDVALVCANGETVDAHKVVFALYSTLLWEIFSSGGGEEEGEETLVILLPQFPANLVRACMDLLYKGEVVLSRRTDNVEIGDCLSNMLGINRALQKFGIIFDDSILSCERQELSSESVGKSESSLAASSGDSSSTGLFSDPAEIADKSTLNFDHRSSKMKPGEMKQSQHENVKEKAEKVKTEDQSLNTENCIANNLEYEHDDDIFEVEREVGFVGNGKVERRDDSIFLMLDNFEAEEGFGDKRTSIDEDNTEASSEVGGLSKIEEGIFHFKPQAPSEPKLIFDPLGTETFLLKSLLLKDKHERDRNRIETVRKQKKLYRLKRRARRREKAGRIEEITQGVRDPMPKTAKQLFSCWNCDYTTTKASRLERHQKREKREIDKKLPRKVREIKFVKKKKNKNIPTDENRSKEENASPRLYFCKECKYSTNNSFNLKRHEDNLHKGLLHKCDVEGCDYTNSQLGNTVGHKKARTNKTFIM